MIMDTPIRKMQKRNDYNRHKLLRKIKRQRQQRKEQDARIAEKELKRKLKLKQPRFAKGKDDIIDPEANVEELLNVQSGLNFNFDPVTGNTIIRDSYGNPVNTNSVQYLDELVVPGTDLQKKQQKDLFNMTKGQELQMEDQARLQTLFKNPDLLSKLSNDPNAKTIGIDEANNLFADYNEAQRLAENLKNNDRYRMATLANMSSGERINMVGLGAPALLNTSLMYLGGAPGALMSGFASLAGMPTYMPSQLVNQAIGGGIADNERFWLSGNSGSYLTGNPYGDTFIDIFSGGVGQIPQQGLSGLWRQGLGSAIGTGTLAASQGVGDLVFDVNGDEVRTPDAEQRQNMATALSLALAPAISKAGRYVNNKVLGNLGSLATYANGLRFDGTVDKRFFRDPTKAYRITEFPEIEGIREAGKNVTTQDAKPGVDRANDWRLAAFDNYAYSKDGSWYKLPQSVESYLEDNPRAFMGVGGNDIMNARINTKPGSAHGNRSQASLGKLWNGGLSTSRGLFPDGVLEIQGGDKVDVGKNRRLFSTKNWESAPIGSRVGYKTGEMPLDNLTWYQRLPNGRYTMGEPVLPNKTIYMKDNSQPINQVPEAFNPFEPNNRWRAMLKPLTNNIEPTGFESPMIDIRSIARDNSQIVRPDGSINPRMLVKGLQELKALNPEGESYKTIFNSGPQGDGRTNLAQHTKGVVETAQQIPVPLGYTRQDLVQSALFHDIGKVIDRSQGMHEGISADMLTNAMNSKNGILPVQRINDAVVNAIRNHGDLKHMVDASPLTQALHLADVARGLSYDQSALTYPQLLTYPRKFPKFNFPELPLRDELKTVINPWLKIYGYEPIKLNSTRKQAEQQLEDRISQHNSWVRSVRGAKDEAQARDWVEHIPYDEIGGRRGFNGIYKKMYGVGGKYDASYMSTSSDIASIYGDDNGRFVVELPRTKESLTSPSLSERLLAGDFEMYDSQKVGQNRIPIGSFSMLEGPYRLQTGRSLLSDMKKDGLIKQEPMKKYQLDFIDDINRDAGFMWDGDNLRRPGYRDYLNLVNSVLRENGFKEIDPFFEKYDEYGTMTSPGMVPPRELLDLKHRAETVREINEWAKKYEELKPQIVEHQKVEKEVARLEYLVKNKINDLASYEMSRMLPFDDFADNTEREYRDMVSKLEKARGDLEDARARESKLRELIDGANTVNIHFLQNYVSPKQFNAFMHSSNPKYLDVKRILSDGKKQYFENYKKYYKNRRMRMKQPTEQEMLEYMRKKGVRPRFEYQTFNNFRTFTPSDHKGDAVTKLTTINKPMGEAQIGLIGKKGEKKLTIKKPISKEEIFENVKKESRNRPYKDYGPRIKSIKLSRKTLR